jgi:hypothetical protein
VIDILNCQPVQYDELRLAQQSKELSYGIY